MCALLSPDMLIYAYVHGCVYRRVFTLTTAVTLAVGQGAAGGRAFLRFPSTVAERWLRCVS